MAGRTQECASYFDKEPHALTLLRAKEVEKDLNRARVLPALRDFKKQFWGNVGILSPITTVYPDTSLRYVVGYKLSFDFPWSGKEDNGRFGVGKEVPITATHVISAQHAGRSLAQITGSLDFAEPQSQRAIVVTSDLGINIADRLRGVESAEVARMARDGFLLEEVRLEDKIVTPTHTLIDSFRDRDGVDLELIELLARYGESLRIAGLLPRQLDTLGKIKAAVCA